MHTSKLLLLALAGVVQSHMHLNYNYGCCGQEVPGPCKGHLNLVDTDQGKPVVTWAPGQKVNFTLSGSSTTEVRGGTHYGGSCSVGFSTDKGNTFKVATTWNGNCPHREGSIDPSTQTFDFTVPADLPAGDRTIFAWTWVNREKEFNMNCALQCVSEPCSEAVFKAVLCLSVSTAQEPVFLSPPTAKSDTLFVQPTYRLCAIHF
jgi:hypothetical protein